MDSLLSAIPKALLVVLVLGVGIAFIILASPPHTVCESQTEVFHEAQSRFLFLNDKRPQLKTSKYRELVDQCKRTNDPGGCYELFQETRMMLRDLQAVPSDCIEQVGDIPEVKKAITEVEDLLVRLAWTDKPPTTYHMKFGWLDTADISLYCLLKQQWIDTYGEEDFEAFREKLFHQLPGADKMSRNEIWDMTIFSENCARYP